MGDVVEWWEKFTVLIESKQQLYYNCHLMSILRLVILASFLPQRLVIKTHVGVFIFLNFFHLSFSLNYQSIIQYNCSFSLFEISVECILYYLNPCATEKIVHSFVTPGLKSCLIWVTLLFLVCLEKIPIALGKKSRNGGDVFTCHYQLFISLAREFSQWIFRKIIF